VPSNDPIQRFEDILENINRIEDFTAGMDLTAFVEDVKTSNATERCLERISEAAKKLGEAAEQLCPDIPWPEVRAIVHVSDKPSKWKSNGMPSGRRRKHRLVKQVAGKWSGGRLAGGWHFFSFVDDYHIKHRRAPHQPQAQVLLLGGSKVRPRFAGIARRSGGRSATIRTPVRRNS
jgi:hypothetical protein